jgi:hypothetical protein
MFFIGIIESWRLRWMEHAACIRKIIIARIFIRKPGKKGLFEIIWD